MTLALFFFYVFSIIAVASALMVIASRNPVHSVLFLILCFVNAAGLFVLMGAEFLAMILIVVYVGAVAVLFLFVIMKDLTLRECVTLFPMIALTILFGVYPKPVLDMC